MGKIVYIFNGGDHMNNKTTVFDVADYFLKIVDREAGSSITHLKLQKLVYYAQAWHLVFTGERMFDSEIQAWVHGPVSPELYKKYADYGYDNLPAPKELPILSEDKIKTIKVVWESYGHFDGKYLEQLTHQEEPWRSARNGCKPWEHCTNSISTELMKEYYKKLNEE